MSARRLAAGLRWAGLPMVMAMAMAMAWPALAATQAPVVEPIEAFLPRWRAALAAVEAGDGRPLAALSRLPFLLQGQALDHDSWARAAPGLFDARLRRCLAQARPQREGQHWLLHCTPYSVYLRAGADGRWRLDGFDADGEAVPTPTPAADRDAARASPAVRR